MSGLADAINAVKDTTGITASYDKNDNTIQLVNYDGYDIKIIDFYSDASDASNKIAIKVNGNELADTDKNSAGTEADSITIGGQISLVTRDPSFKVSTTDSTGTLFATSSPIVTQKSSISAGVPLGNGVAAQKLTIQGIETKAVYIDANDSAKEIADKVNAESASTVLLQRLDHRFFECIKRYF